jgi:hypothetical protein
MRIRFDWKTIEPISYVTVKWTPVSNMTYPVTTGSKTYDYVTSPGIYSGSFDEIVTTAYLDSESSFEISVTVSDTKDNTRKVLILESSVFTMDMLNGGNGIAFGKAAEKSGYADFAFKTIFREDVIFDENNRYIYGTSPDGTTKNAFQPQNENGNTVLGFGNYETKNGNTNIYGYDLNFGVSNMANPGTYRPYRRCGDSLTFTIRTAGYVTNGGKDVSFLVPFAVPIVGAPTVTVSSNNGFVLRQGTKYTHGSTADSYAIPDSYSANIAWLCGVYITAHFTDVTDVINNDTIGIYWNGTITFS